MQRVAAWMRVAQGTMYFRRRVNLKIVTSLNDCDCSSGRPSLQIQAFSRRFVRQRAAEEGQSVAMRMPWNVIVRTHLLLRTSMATNVLPGTRRSRSVLSWGVPSRLLPTLCLLIANPCVQAIHASGPRWLYLVALQSIWTGLIRVTPLIRGGVRERAERRLFVRDDRSLS